MRYIRTIGGTPSTALKRTRETTSENNITVHPNTAQNNSYSEQGSPTKRMKSAQSSSARGNSLESSSAMQRNFGEVLSTNNHSLNRTSIASEASCESKHLSDVDDDVSDCGTTVSSVAHLRARLQEFGQKNQKHYVQSNSAALKDAEVVVERRPKVRPSHGPPTGPTPLPPAAAHALVKRIAQVAPPATVASAVVATPIPTTNDAVSLTTKHGVSASTCQSSSKSSTNAAAVFRAARATPVRIRIPVVPSTNVQATNEGYASVAQLSRWLADDPTSTKKTRQLRRGANIIAKSRKFDKVLANVVVEECIPRDCVSRQKHRLAKAWSDDHDVGGGGPLDDLWVQSLEPPSTSTTTTTAKKDWQTLGEPTSSSNDNSTNSRSMSVSEKKKWLLNAFPSNASGSRAQSEILTSDATNSEIGLRAKEKWRRNHRTPTKLPTVKDSL